MVPTCEVENRSDRSRASVDLIDLTDENEVRLSENEVHVIYDLHANVDEWVNGENENELHAGEGSANDMRRVTM